MDWSVIAAIRTRLSQRLDPARSRWIEVGWGVACLVFATLLRWSLEPWLHNRGSYGMYFMAAIAAAWYAGWLSGTFTLTAGTLLGTTLFPVGGVLNADSPSYLVGLFFYLLLGELLVTLVSAQLYQRRRANRNEAEAASRRKWLDAVLASIGDGVIVLDLDERVVEINRVAESLTGWESAEAIGRPLGEIARFVGEMTFRTAEQPIFDPLTSSSVIAPIEPSMMLTRDHREIAVDVRRTAIRDDSGQVTGYAVAIRDETERRGVERTLRESEANFRDLADNISQFAWMADETGYLFWYNQRWFDYTGTTLDEMKGWGWRAVHHPDHVDRVTQKYRQHIESGEPWEDTFPLRSRDGDYCWFLSRARPVRDESGRIVRWFGTNTDVTDQRRLDEALRQADQRKDEYVAMLAHELRNPLAAIRSTIDALRLTSGDPSVLATSTDDLTRQVGQVVHLIDDLLDVSRIGHGKINLQRRVVSLREVAITTLAIAQPLIDAQKHKLTTALPEEQVWLDADPVRLAQALSNVLINAAKYTDSGGHISFRGNVYGTDLILRVKDNGVGLDAAALGLIFEPFHQIRTTIDRAQGGLGLGLTLVKHLIEQHGGTVSAHSDGIGRGSEFLIRLPVATAAGDKPEQRVIDGTHAAPKAKSKSHRVLIADDNQAAAGALARVVRLLGHEVSVVFDGLAAKDALLAEPLDVAILDIGMPKMTGHEVARAVREAAVPDQPLLVALTGWGKPQDRDRSREAGFDHHLVKPVELDALRSILDGVPSAGAPRT